MKKLKILISGLILVSILSGTVLAQEIPEVQEDEKVLPSDLEISEPKILPDNPLYFLKDLARAIRLFFVLDVTKRTELRLKFANEKIYEVKKLAELKRDPRLIEKTLISFEKDIAKISELSGEELKKFSQKLLHQQILHQRILQKLESQVPPETMEKIREKRMLHLEKFAKVMEKMEEREKIAEKIEEELEKIPGSKFKDFKNLEIIEELKEKLPENLKQKIEEKKLKIIEKLREKLERMTDEEKEKFKEYLEQIVGDKLKHLEIMSNLEADEISEKLREKIEEAKEKKIEEIAKERKISATSAQDQILKAEEEIKKAEEKVAKISENEYGGRAAKKLLELAKKHLEKAKEAFSEGKYGRTFGLATAAYHEAVNVERIVEKIEEIKKSPEKMKEKLEKLYPGIEFPKDIQICSIPAKPECGEGEVWRIGKDEKGCPVFVCEKEEKLLPAPPIKCELLWYFDNETRYCQQKKFCGHYMYEGLRTFRTKEECEEGLKQEKSEQGKNDKINLCVDRCGDGICQEIVCMALGCPCPETKESCPQDCK